MTSRQRKSWPLQDAKARFSELLDVTLTEGPQIVTRRGVEAAVLVPVDQWRRLVSSSQPSLKDLLLSDDGRAELPTVPRRARRRRSPAAIR